jgi:AAA+ ATPase superfamily predicted ATPase
VVAVAEYVWLAAGEFLGRNDELDRLDRWWAGPSREPINLFGHRRVGKSWLFRKFADGKPALLLVAERTTPTQQLSKLAEQLEPALGVKPEIKDIGTLFKILYQLANTKTLVVIDEFPYLLGTSQSEVTDSLSAVQAAMELYRDSSQIKLILCGSAVAQMEDLQSERSPLHGRLQPLPLRPLEFPAARLFMPNLDPLDQFTRFSVTGGMPRYLSLLSADSLKGALADSVVDRNSPLFAEPLSILQAELREPTVYMAILGVLAIKPADIGTISAGTGLASKALFPYLEKLSALDIIAKRLPVGADPKTRSRQWVCSDDFIRFWFRFVLPFTADLEAGADAQSHVETHILPVLAGHTAQTFEELFRRWMRQEYSQASRVGAWWGPSLHVHRQAKERFTEEIDAVGIKNKNLVVVGEAKWTNKTMPTQVLADLRTFKIPAMAQDGFKAVQPPHVVLVSRGGFSEGLLAEAERDARITLLLAQDLFNQVH